MPIRPCPGAQGGCSRGDALPNGEVERTAASKRFGTKSTRHSGVRRGPGDSRGRLPGLGFPVESSPPRPGGIAGGLPGPTSWRDPGALEMFACCAVVCFKESPGWLDLGRCCVVGRGRGASAGPLRRFFPALGPGLEIERLDPGRTMVLVQGLAGAGPAVRRCHQRSLSFDYEPRQNPVMIGTGLPGLRSWRACSGPVHSSGGRARATRAASDLVGLFSGRGARVSPESRKLRTVN